MKRRSLLLAWAVLVSGLGNLAAAHEARPLAVSIVEVKPAQYREELRAPSSIAPDNRPALVWPMDCRPVTQALMQCAQPLEGRELGLAWPLFNPAITTLLRFTPQGGTTRSVVLGPEVARWQVPARPTTMMVLRDYFQLGIGHILFGIDHLLFVAGLLLIARGLRSILLAITGFTVAHSITLTLAALGLVHVPVPPTEAAIALSIVFVAREALRTGRDTLALRHPAAISMLFGLLHGLGFAAALGEIGLPEREVVTALLFFNLGVEAGQLAFIMVLVCAVALLQRLQRVSIAAGRFSREACVRVAAYVIGIPATFWLLQRTFALYA